jgi:hypothetical protein
MKPVFKTINNNKLVIVAIAVLNVIIHISVAWNLEYHRDELLYFSLGVHPAAGFATVPPMIGWLAWIIQNIFGYSLFAVRILPALMSGVMVILIAAIARELGGSRYAEILSATGFTVAGFALRTFILFQPVHLDMFFWTLIIFIVVKYVNSENDNYLLYFGIAAGASLLNKYLIGLLFAAIALIIPFTRHRVVFTKKMFWYGIASGFVVFLPNLIWQAVNGFPVFNHLSELNRTQLTNVNRVSFLIDQVLNPVLASILTIAGILFLLFSKKMARFRFIGLIMMFAVVFLMVLRGKSYYTQGIFPFLIAAGAVSYDLWLKRMVPRVVLPLLMVLLTIPILPMALPVMNSKALAGYFRDLEVKQGIVIGRTFEDNTIHSLPQDYADMIGWEELTEIADSAYKMIEDKHAAFIYCENYGQAGAITVIGKKYGLPEPVCFSESFRYWIPEEFNPDITSVVYINDEMGDDVKTVFRKIIKVGSITNPDAREYGTTVWLCRDPAGSFNTFWKMRLDELRRE